MKKKIKLLITGGTGFIGYHLAKQALAKGWIVTSISTNLPRKNRVLKKVNYKICDISNKKILAKNLKENFTYVVNLAGYVDHSNNKKTYKSHFLGCKNLADIFLSKRINLLYKWMMKWKATSHKENINCKPISNYGISKNLSTKYLLKLYEKFDFPVTIFRLYQSYGKNQDINNCTIVINSCIKNKFSLFSRQTKKRFSHIDDVIKALFISMKNKKQKVKY